MSWFANFKKINTMDSNDHPKALVDILPTDKKLHQRESQWLGVIQVCLKILSDVFRGI